MPHMTPALWRHAATPRVSQPRPPSTIPTFVQQARPLSGLEQVHVKVVGATCGQGERSDSIETYVDAAESLKTKSDGSYQFNWSPSRDLAGACVTLHVDSGDGLDHAARFALRRR